MENRSLTARPTPRPGSAGRVHVLGPVLVSHHGVSTPVLSGRAGRLLTALALARGEWVDDETLVAVLWPDPPRTAVAQLHITVSRLRRQFACLACESWLESRPHGYRLGPAVDTDVAAFERDLEQAGRARADDDPDTLLAVLESAVDRWGTQVEPQDGLVADDVGLARSLRHALLELAELEVRAGRLAAAGTRLRRLLEDDPYDEHVGALLVRCLGSAGRTEEAGRLGESLVRRLAEDLGVPPGDELADAVAVVPVPTTVRRTPWSGSELSQDARDLLGELVRVGLAGLSLESPYRCSALPELAGWWRRVMPQGPHLIEP